MNRILFSLHGLHFTIDETRAEQSTIQAIDCNHGNPHNFSRCFNIHLKSGQLKRKKTNRKSFSIKEPQIDVYIQFKTYEELTLFDKTTF